MALRLYLSHISLHLAVADLGATRTASSDNTPASRTSPIHGILTFNAVIVDDLGMSLAA